MESEIARTDINQREKTVLWCCRLAQGPVRPAPFPSNSEAEDQAIRILMGHGLAPLIPCSTDAGLPPKIQQEIEKARSFTLARNVLQMEAAESLQKALEGARIPAALLKGAALLVTKIYQPGERPMSDVDLLVKRENLERACALLESLDWAPLNDSAHGWQQRHHHHLSWKSCKRPGLALDLHFTPSAGERRLPTWEKLTEPATMGTTARLTAEAHLWFLATNAAFHGFTGRLLLLLDLSRYLDAHQENLNWSKLGELADETSTRRAVRLALSLSRTAFGSSVEPPAAWDLTTEERRVVGSLFPISKWEGRWRSRFLRLWAADNWSERLRMSGAGISRALSAA